MDQSRIRVFIGVGSNLGNREESLRKAAEAIRRIPKTRWLRSSKVLETEPVGGPAQGRYLNAVWEIETGLSPQELLREFLAIETGLGRVRTVRDAPRTLDLDLLFYGTEVLDFPELKVPHPRLQERRFVLEPMAELAPEWQHPVLKQSMKQLLESLP